MATLPTTPGISPSTATAAEVAAMGTSPTTADAATLPISSTALLWASMATTLTSRPWYSACHRTSWSGARSSRDSPDGA